jgi:cell division protein FtsQ
MRTSITSTPAARSDKLRAQRSEKAKQRVNSASLQIKKAPVTRPAVTVRGSSGTPVIKRAYSRPRRQFAFSVGSSGVEMLTPAIPVFKPGWRLLSAVLTVLSACLLILITNLSDFRVQQPVLFGFERVTAADIENVLMVSGEPIYAINPMDITTQLQSAFPELTNIEVRANFPSNVIISVSERQPVIAWEFGDAAYWIDAEGYVFSPRGEAAIPLTVVSEDAPPLQQFANKSEQALDAEAILQPERVKTDILQAAQKLSEQLGTGAVIVYSAGQGLGWSDPRGWKVYIGSSLNNIDAKVKVYRTLVDKVLAQGAQPTLFNVEFLDAPYYRLEQ